LINFKTLMQMNRGAYIIIDIKYLEF
jgi:hypothetical protein